MTGVQTCALPIWLMTEGYVKGGLYAMTAIIFYVFFMFRNVRTVFFVLLPVLAGSIWTVGVMELIGLKLNMANLVILPLILGVGVVNGIHITHRYREEEDKHASVLGSAERRVGKEWTARSASHLQK